MGCDNDVYWARVSLVLTSKELAVAEISETLDHASVGPATTRDGKYSLWVCETDLGSDAPLEQHLASMFSWLDSRKEALMSLANHCDANLRVGLATAGTGVFALGPHELQLLASAGIDLYVDLYAAE